MKLVNLFEYDRPSHSIDIDHESTSTDSIEYYLSKHGGKKLGSGFFGIVYDKPGDIQTVIKRGRVVIEDNRFSDGYLHFIFNLMTDHRAKDNPFLPQIYTLKIKRDSRQTPTYTYIIEIEKLEEFEDAGGTMISTITKKSAIHTLDNDPHSMFSQMLTMLANLVNVSEHDLIDYVYYTNSVFSDNDNGKVISINAIWSMLTEILIKGGKNPLNIKIVNKQFLEAVRLLKRYKSNKVLYDLHAGNVMIRRTPYGPQLVITDPYS